LALGSQVTPRLGVGEEAEVYQLPVTWAAACLCNTTRLKYLYKKATFTPTFIAILFSLFFIEFVSARSVTMTSTTPTFTRRKTALAILEAYESWNLDTIMSFRTPDCIQEIIPSAQHFPFHLIANEIHSQPSSHEQRELSHLLCSHHASCLEFQIDDQ
jgi:hypothetical protein